MTLRSLILRVGKELLPSRVKNVLFYPCPLLRVTFLWQEGSNALRGQESDFSRYRLQGSSCWRVCSCSVGFRPTLIVGHQIRDFGVALQPLLPRAGIIIPRCPGASCLSQQPGWGNLPSRHQRRSSARHSTRSAMA